MKHAKRGIAGALAAGAVFLIWYHFPFQEDFTAYALSHPGVRLLRREPMRAWRFWNWYDYATHPYWRLPYADPLPEELRGAWHVSTSKFVKKGRFPSTSMHDTTFLGVVEDRAYLREWRLLPVLGAWERVLWTESDGLSPEVIRELEELHPPPVLRAG